ncbi:ser thr protein kinase [Chrysochromulina tobinii]|uniref:Ser thr protein kinase n=1 Tax=Chrysochromulina tobinii TaxID=1460289 RepID=A0A0M0K6G3_9EUKA|nr:ser thr protein kinase [Chrysochromulina tobinii]|eukprot:KOO34399.1 ser thr protein kinase [Chrysochromulina sp. CCMP291]
MLVRPAGSSIVVNEEQPRKVLLSMLVRPRGSLIDVIEEQARKANSPMLVRPAGSAIVVNEEQSSKACSPMLVRLAGSSINVNEEQSRKAYRPRFARLMGSSIDVIEEQREKANSPMLVRPAGSSIVVNEEQPWKAHSPMLVRPVGSVIDVMDLSPRNAFAGTRALPWRSAHAASSTSIGGTSIGASPTPRMHPRIPAIGYESSPDDATLLSAATSTSKPPSPVTLARLGSPHAASAASAKRRPAARLPERSSVVTLPRLLASGRPTRAHSRAQRTRRARARHARLTPLSARSVGTSANARAFSRTSSVRKVESLHMW